jgi:hypothetical protein
MQPEINKTPGAQYNSAFLEEWRRQYFLLGQQEREAIDQNPLGPEGDRLEASVISTLAAKPPPAPED